MATLETIRTRAGVFISIIIGIALLSFIISPESLQRASMMFSSKYDAGEVAGKSISVQDYQNRVGYQTELYKEMNGGDASINDQVSEQIREQAWQEIIKEEVLFKEFEKVGIVVSDEEMTDLVNGADPSPIVRQYFTNPQTGQFDRSSLLNVIQNLDSDPNLKRQWLAIENQVKENQIFTKYSNLLTKSMVFNSLDIKDAVASTSTNVEFSFIMKPYLIGDTLSQPTTAELKKYYNENQNLYEQTRSRDLQYLSFQIKSSADDYRLTMENMLKIENNFIAMPVAELGMFVNRNSEKVFDDTYHAKGELPLALDTFAFGEELGAFLPIYQDDETYNMARISGIKNLSDSVHARHILLRNPQSILKADSIITALKGGADFATLASEFSEDQGANLKGGDLGWFTFRKMVRPFSDSCFFNPKGKIVKVRTQFGEHIVQILDKSAETKHVQVAHVQLAIVPGKITSQNIYNQANSIASESGNDQKKFIELAAAKGLYVQAASRIGLNDKRVANFTNARDLVRWAYEAEVGNVSDVFEIDNSYFVIATLTDIREDGIAPFEQVKSDVEIAVKKEKQANLIAEELKAAMQSANNIEDLAAKTNLQVSNTSSPINFTTMYVPGLMVAEPKLVGAATSSAENTLTGPIKGEGGVYVYTVTSKTQTEVDPASEKARLVSAASMRAYDFYNILIEKAKVKDNRGKFY